MSRPSLQLPPEPADLLNAVNVAIICVSLDGRIQSWNRAAETLFERNAEEAMGAELLTLVPEDRRAETMNHFRRCAGGEAFSITDLCQRGSGEIIEAVLSYAPFPEAEGETAGVCVVVQQIAAHRARSSNGNDGAARRPLETAENLEALIRHASLPIVCLDPEGRVLLWNPSAENLLGRRAEDLLGRQIPASSEDGLDSELRAIAASSRDSHWETKAINPDGSVLDVTLWKVPLWLDGREVDASVAILVDATERKFLQRALFEATERESRRIGQELHDQLCQQLLGAAFGAKAVAMAMEANSPAAAELHKLARLINSAVHETREIARGLSPVELDAGGLMAALQELADRTRTGPRCRFECEQPVFLPNAEVALHAYRIAQEALSNAAMHSGATEIVIRLKEDNRHVYLEVADNGTGGLSADESGGGLGLRIIKLRVQAIHGKLTVHTASGKGTSVTCRLPKRR